MSGRYRLLIAAFACCLASTHGAAQDIAAMPHEDHSPLDRPLSELHHTAFGEREGAPASAFGITQSPDGFLWLGGARGVSRFDGVQFDERITSLLRKRAVRTVFADGPNRFWVGYLLGGLDVIDNGHVVHYEPDVDIPGGTVMAVTRGPDGLLWMATTKGIARLMGGRWRQVGKDLGYTGTQPESAHWTGDTFWINDVGGAWHMRAGDTRLTWMDRNAGIEQQWSQFGQPARIYNPDQDGEALVDSSGAMWVAIARGLERLRWIADEHGQMHRTRETFTRADGLSSDDVNGFFEDREHNVWVLTSAGIDQFRATTLHPVALTGQFSRPLMVPGDNATVLVFSTWQAPFEVSERAVTPLGALPSGVTAATRDRDGNIWLAGYTGLFRYRQGKLEKVTLPDALKDVGSRFQALAMDDQGVLWVSASAFGLYRLDHGVWTRDTTPALPPDMPLRMLNDGQGRLWLAYPHDVLVFRTATGMRRYTAADGLDAGNVMSIAVKGAHVWVGGDEGLFVLRGDRFVRVAGRGGEVFRGVAGIVETDAGDLWINALDGAFRIAASDVQTMTKDSTYQAPFRRYGADEGRNGLPDGVRPLPRMLQGADGKIWIGTRTSVTWVDPSHLLQEGRVPSIAIDTVVAGDKAYLVDGPVQLPPLTHRVEIEYTAASVTNARSTRFRYRLEGVDDGWQDAGLRRRAAYTNVPPGHYRFHVQAFNEGQEARAASAEMALVVMPAWYQATTFRLACIALVVLALWWAYRLRSRHNQQRVRATMEARHGERERIARELHDTLLQSVQGMLLRVQAWSSDSGIPWARRDEMKATVQHAREMVIDGRDRIMALRQQAEPREPLANAIRHTGEEYAQAHHMAFALTERGRVRELCAEVADEVTEIVREAVRNAFMHSQGQNVSVRIVHGWFYLLVTVSDDGRGMPEHVLHGGVTEGHWGLNGMRERAWRIGARLAFRKLPAGGTDVRLRVPCFMLRPHLT